MLAGSLAVSLTDLLRSWESKWAKVFANA